MYMNIARIKKSMREASIRQIANMYLIQDALPGDIVRSMKQHAHIKLATVVTDIPQGGLNTLRRMRALAHENRSFTEEERQLLRQWERLKHPIEWHLQLVAPIQGVFKSLTTVLNPNIKNDINWNGSCIRFEVRWKWREYWSRCQRKLSEG